MECNYWKKTKPGGNMNNYYINDDGRVHVKQLNLVVTSRCNLKCKQCCHLNQLRTYDGDSIEDLLYYLEKWTQRLDIQTLNIIGGEPLLLHDLPEIIRGARAILPENNIEIWTNGTLLHEHDVLWEVCHECRISVLISDHLKKPSNADILDRYGVCYKRANQQTFFRFYHWSQDGLPICPNSDPAKAWMAHGKACHVRDCTAFYRNRLFQCAIHGSRVMAQDEGILPVETWGHLTALPYMTLDNTPAEIAEYLNRIAPPECAGCPEQQPRCNAWET